MTGVAYGPITNDITGLGVTRRLVGGDGACRWKQLINGMHLTGPWNCVEYVVIPPGSSCGEHVHSATEEIYYILSGTALMHIDGAPMAVRAGDIVTAPIGTAHTIRNDSDREMTFFVVEVFPQGERPGTPERVNLADLIDPSPAAGITGARPAGTVITRRDGGVRASIDLSGRFAGSWDGAHLLRLNAGDADASEPRATIDEVIFVVRGSARVEYGDESMTGNGGLCVAVPPGTGRRIINLGDQPLEILTVEVRVP